MEGLCQFSEKLNVIDLNHIMLVYTSLCLMNIFQVCSVQSACGVWGAAVDPFLGEDGIQYPFLDVQQRSTR
jgi:hypothetical protein